MDSGTDDWWSTTVGSSQLCGACHNVKVDMNGNGLSPVTDDNTSTTDADGNFTLDQNELDVDANGQLQDLVLQTTFDEWQDYVAGFEARIKSDPRNKIEAPLGCTDCHMPTTGDGKQAVVDFAPGLLSKPDRTYRSHMFVGVDYDLDTAHYEESGMPANALQTVLDARQALIESAVTLEVVDKGPNANGDDVQSVVVQNNLLGHNFPTGFAFARQFWLEVTANDRGRQRGVPHEAVERHRHPVLVGRARVSAGRAASVRSGERPAGSGDGPDAGRPARRARQDAEHRHQVLGGVPGERLRSVVDELPEDPDRR